MRVVSLALNNWCQHKKRHMDFHGANLIGLLGDNGTGKSNIFKGMEFAVTGETEDKLEEYVMDGAAKATVKMFMSLQESSIEVTRTVTKKDGKSTAKLVTTNAGHEPVTITGVTKVNKELELILQLDKDLAKNNIFVAQKHLDDILFTTPAKRERAWQRMCGMADAEKIHDKLGKALNNLPDNQDFTAQVLDCRNNIEKIESEIEEGEAQVKELLESPNLQFELSKIFNQLNALRVCSEARVKLPELQAKRDTARAVLTAEETNLEASRKHLAEFTTTDEEDQYQISTVEDLLTRMERFKTLSDNVQFLETELARHQENLAGLPALNVDEIEAELEKVHNQYLSELGEAAALEADLTMYSKLKNVIDTATTDLAECPLCGSNIDDRQRVLDRVNSQVKKLDEELSAKKEAQNESLGVVNRGKAKVAEHGRLVETYTSAVKTAEANLETSKTKLSELEDLKDYNEDHLRNVLADIRKRVSAKESAINAIPLQESAVARAKSGLEDAEGMLKGYEEAAAKFGEDVDVDEQIRVLTELHRKVQDEQRQLTAVETAVETNGKNLEQWKKTLAELERQSGLGTTYTKIRQSLERVRHWFHYSQGPHKLSMAVLNELTTGVNEFLATLDGRFIVEPDPENLMFNIIFVDGREQPDEPRSATRASGGEKSSLSTSFRLASYYMFAGSLGMLCLDEPTEYLDARKIESFGRVIEQLKEISGQLDLQIFMATHREMFVPLFDTVVQL